MNIEFRELGANASPEVAAQVDVDVPILFTHARDAFGEPLIVSGVGPDLRLVAWGKEGRVREDAVTRHWVSDEPVTPDIVAGLLSAAFRAGEQSARHGFRNKLLKLMEL